jgi:hypothetical protein
MLALESRDAKADRDEFEAASIGDFALFEFEREGRLADGSAAKLAFSLAFATDAQAPDIGFFACQEHHPENFWNPAFRTHANGASEIAGVVVVAQDPADHQTFLSAFVGQRSTATSTTLTATTPRGVIEVVHPDTFRAHFAVEPPPTSHGARLAALRVTVRDFGAAVTALKAGEIDAQVRMGRIIVGPEMAMGATLAFAPA